jgi:hypothetical protein
VSLSGGSPRADRKLVGVTVSTVGSQRTTSRLGKNGN